MVWYAWVLVALFALGALATIARIDKPREPIDTGTAIATVIIHGLYVWAIVSLAT